MAAVVSLGANAATACIYTAVLLSLGFDHESETLKIFLRWLNIETLIQLVSLILTIICIAADMSCGINKMGHVFAMSSCNSISMLALNHLRLGSPSADYNLDDCAFHIDFFKKYSGYERNSKRDTRSESPVDLSGDQVDQATSHEFRQTCHCSAARINMSSLIILSWTLQCPCNKC
jgi:hypothetical protein